MLELSVLHQSGYLYYGTLRLKLKYENLTFHGLKTYLLTNIFFGKEELSLR